MSKVTLDLDIFDTPLKELNLEPPLCVESDLSLHDAVKVMQDKHVGALLCLKNNQLEGIITERDYLMKVLNNIDDLESSSLSNI
ncbi:MAG: CBS domain-containing protein, partial [Bdellovibrionales bacterium]|nr:CBS domain-containing protein [Bdellovibrionales bacterium]